MAAVFPKLCRTPPPRAATTRLRSNAIRSRPIRKSARPPAVEGSWRCDTAGIRLKESSFIRNRFSRRRVPGSSGISCGAHGNSSADCGNRKGRFVASVRVRVSGLVLLVGSFLALRVEALTASAGRPVVRVAHEEAAPRDALGIVHARAVEVLLAVAVNEDFESVHLDDLVVLVDLPVEGEAVTEAGAAAARHVHPEIRVLDRAQWLAGLGIGPLDELLDFVRCGFGQGDLNHCTPPHPPNTMTPLFNPLVVSCATPRMSANSFQ